MTAVRQLLIVWLLFSVVLGLAHLFIGLTVWGLHRKRRALYLMFKDGALLFFAMPLVASAFGELLIAKQALDSHGFAVSLAAGILVFILSICGAIYAVIVTHDCLQFAKVRQRTLLDEREIFHSTLFLSVAAIAYSAIVTGMRLHL